MMGSFVYFFILLIILQVLSPLLYAYPIVGLLLWVGIIGWFLYRNKKQREAFYKAQQQQQDYYQQQQQQDAGYSQTQSRPHVDEKDVIDAEYTEREIK
jgi:flagellar biosynthesis component FlhA